MTTKNVSNVGSGSVVGSIAVGQNARAEGTVSYGATTAPVTQEQHRAAIKTAQTALIEDQDRLDSLLYEGLHQFLRIAREIQVEQKALADVQSKMKETLDDVWAQQAAKGMKPQVLPRTLELAQALIANPAMVEVVKALVGSP